MKNFKFTISTILVILSFLLVGGCSDILNPSAEKHAGKSSVPVTISISDSVGRTLLPDTPVFEKYQLTFTANSGQTEPEENPVELENSSQYTLVLEPGSWTVSVIGMVLIENMPGIDDGYYEAAASGPVNFTAGAGASNTIAVTVRGGIQAGVKGMFSWDISYPEEVIAGTLEILDLLDELPIDGFEPLDLMDEDNLAGTASLYPGYYLLKAELENTDHNKAYRTEILHIYSGMITAAGSGNGYAFTAASFAPMVTLNGQVLLSTDEGLNPQGKLYLYRDAGYSQLIEELLLGEDGAWTYRISTFYSNVYLKVDVEYTGFEVIERTKGPINITSTNSADWIFDVTSRYLVDFIELAANGSLSETTTKLIITFDKDINDLSVADIELTPALAKGSFTKTDTGVYELEVSGIYATGQVNTTTTKYGYAINGSPQTAQVYYAIPVAFTNLEADGSITATTTKLTLSFDQDITDLAVSDIELTPALTKGSFTRIDTGVYEMELSELTASGQVDVTVTKGGYNISGNPRMAQVYYAIPVAFTGLVADGSENVATTKFTFTFDKDITDLSAADIELTPALAKGSFTRIDIGVYELELSEVTASGQVSTTVAKYGYAINGNPQTAQVYYAIPVAFTNLEADGSVTATTTKLTLSFDQDITDLAVSDIELTPALTKGLLTNPSTGVYELELSGIIASGQVDATVTKGGYNISGNPRMAQVYYAIPIAFTGLVADGSENVATTTKLTLTFDKNISGLSVEDITLIPAMAKGSLNNTSTGVYELGVGGISNNIEITVIVTKNGYEITGNPQTTQGYYVVLAEFTNLEADGSVTVTTTKLTLTFNKDINGLTAADIILPLELTKGSLTRINTGVYELFVGDIYESDLISVTVSKDGYVITGNPQTVMISCIPMGIANFSITFEEITDMAPVIVGPTLYRISHGGPTTEILTVDNPSQYSSINWRVQNTTVTGLGDSFTLNATNNAYNLIGEHFVTVMVWKDGVPYNKTVSFMVEY